MIEYKRARKSCEICGSFNVEKLFEYDMTGIELHKNVEKNFDIVSCDKCGFIYYDILSSQKKYDEYYNSYSIYENLGKTYGAITECMKNMYYEITEEIYSFVKKDSNILDVGCANGYLLETLRDRGFENLYGLDISDNCLNTVKSKGFEVYRGGVFVENKEMYDKFDCITCTQVLEHVYDLNGAIKNLKSMLKEEGLLYIEVPDASRYHLIANNPFSHFQYEHIVHFDPTSLTNLALKHNLKVKQVIQRDVNFNSFSASIPYISIVLQKIKPEYELSNAKNSVKEFIELSRINLNNTIKDFLETNEPIAIWGLGTSAMLILKEGLENCNIEYIVDTNELKQGMEIYGYKIDSPDILITKNFKGTILITSSLYEIEIIEQIKAMGLTNNFVVFK